MRARRSRRRARGPAIQGQAARAALAHRLQSRSGMMMRSARLPWLIAIAASACGQATVGPDGGLADTRCRTVFRDHDGDGHGDPSAAVAACYAPPPSYVETSDDCDDHSALVHPDAPELCDRLDNDCDGQVDGACPADCAVVLEDHRYLVCRGARAWDDARAACERHGFALAHVDDARENDFLQRTAAAQFATAHFYLGGTDDGAESRWRWGDDGLPIEAPGFTAWAWSQPDNARGRENCLAIGVTSGLWFDDDCGFALPYVCERAGVP